MEKLTNYNNQKTIYEAKPIEIAINLYPACYKCKQTFPRKIPRMQYVIIMISNEYRKLYNVSQPP